MEHTEKTINDELILFDKTSSMDEIVENIFIGNYSAASNKSLLQEKGVTHILIAANNLEKFFPNDFEYKIFPLYDSEYTKITKYFEESNNFIKNSILNGKILIHCGAGISRSVSLLLAYMIANMNMNYSEAIKIMKEKRSIANPNPGFEKQLRNYSYELHKKF